jgi:hypothetical protein
MFEPATGGLPSGPVVSQRVAHFRVKEAEEQGHQEPLNQNKTSSLINGYSFCQLFSQHHQSFFDETHHSLSHSTLRVVYNKRSQQQ